MGKLTEKLETELVVQCQSGSLEWFDVLYDRYIRKIYDYFYYRTHHQQVAEDLTSRTFLKVVEKLNSFNPVRGNFSSWLYQIAHNIVIDYWRTKGNSQEFCDVWDIAVVEGNEKSRIDNLDNKTQLEKVKKYLQQIKPEHREIVILRLWDGLSYAQIAEILDKSEASCKMLYARTTERMRKKFIEAAIFLVFLSQIIS